MMLDRLVSDIKGLVNDIKGVNGKQNIRWVIG